MTDGSVADGSVTDSPVVEHSVRTVFLGSGDFAVPILRSLASHPLVDIVGVVTAPPRPAGRGQDLGRTPVHDAADALRIGPILTPPRLRDPAVIDDVLGLGGELLVLADYGRLVPPALLEPRYGALNVHPSLLPRHRGASPVAATILAGDPETGITLMRMDAGLDTGPIFVQATIALRGDETAPALEARLAEEGAGLLYGHISPWLRKGQPTTPQRTDGATLTRPLRREDGRLDPDRSATELVRQVRAYQPWPGSWVDTVGGRLVVWLATAENDDDVPAPGVFDARGLGVGAGERLVLHEVQPAGGKRMTWEAFVRGRPSIVGSSIVG